MKQIQHLIQSVFSGVDDKTSATIFITLFVFALGQFVVIITKEIGKYTSRKTNRRFFIESLKELNKSLSRQIIGIEETIQTVNMAKEGGWKFSIVKFFQIPYFNEIGFKEPFNGFFSGIENWTYKKVEKQRQHAFNRAWENIRNIEEYADKAASLHTSYLEKYNQFGDKRNVSVSRLQKKANEIFDEQRRIFMENADAIDDNKRDYLNALSKIWSDYGSIPTMERVQPFITHRKLVLKIRILNKKYPKLTFVGELNDIALEASNSYTEMKYTIKYLKQQYLIYQNVLHNAQRTNKKIIEILK